MAEDAKSFSPIRMTASSEAAAVEQALQIAGLSRDQVHVEVLRQDAKGVTVRVSPLRDEEPSSNETGIENDGPSLIDTTLQRDANINESNARVVESAQAADAASEAFEEDIFQSAPIVQASATDSDADSSATTLVETIDSDATSADASGESAPHQYSSQRNARSGVGDEARAPVEIDAETQERARAMAQEFLDRMGMEAQVEITRNGDASSGVDAGGRLHLNIEGEDVGILIGKHGQTLQAFQYLLNVSLNNQPATEQATTEQAASEQGDASQDESARAQSREGSLRVVVDAGGYRERRSQSLEQVAQDAASRAKRDRRSVRLEPMPAYERRLVHLALQEDATVATTSEGRDPLRHVVVSPAGMRPTPSGGFNDRSPRGGFNRNRGGFNAGRGEGGNRGGNRNAG